ncbi:MAG TPA: acyl-CoA dehydrogenase family protein [Caulobacteraceae bacterium]|jgi:acyl-CoA dehydrogenase|nr:acyl-CoA dehydrogenase family protein [Caulobacteraceae bacterium]
MELSLSPELREQVLAAREWGRAEVRPAGLEADRAAAPLPPEHPYFQRFIASGRARARAEASEGPEGRMVRAVVLGEEGAYWDRGMGVATPGAGLPSGAVSASGTAEQKEHFLGRFRDLKEPRWASFALTEPGGGSDTAAFRTRAQRTDRGWVLNGAKCFIGNAKRADWLLVQATLDPSKGRAGQRSFFVEKGTPGFTGVRVEKKMGLRAYESVSFSLEDCEIPAEHILGGETRKERAEGSGASAYGATMGALNSARVGVAASALGIARAALDEARRFAGESGAVRHPRIRDQIERVVRKLRAARLATLHAGWLVDQRRGNIVESSMAKILSAEVAQEAGMLGMEIVGLEAGAGDELIEKLFRDAKALNIVEGTGQIQRVIMARQLVGLPR